MATTIRSLVPRDRRSLFGRLALLALLVEGALLFWLSRIMPDAGPHNTALWALVVPQFPGIMVASEVLRPWKEALEPLWFWLAYYAIIFVVQAALLVGAAYLIAALVFKRAAEV